MVAELPLGDYTYDRALGSKNKNKKRSSSSTGSISHSSNSRCNLYATWRNRNGARRCAKERVGSAKVMRTGCDGNPSNTQRPSGKNTIAEGARLADVGCKFTD